VRQEDLRLNDKTRQRDLKRLRELELVFLDSENRVCLEI
jgi:hypothetical protein